MMRKSAPRVLQITIGPPQRRPPHAGGLLQKDVTESLLRQGAAIIALVPASNRVRAEAESLIGGVKLLFPEDFPHPRFPSGILIRASHHVLGIAARSPLPIPHVPFAVALAVSPKAWRTVREADVIDLQWFQSILLFPVIRLIARREQVIVGTFHDVVSQRLERAGSAMGSEAEDVRRLRPGMGRLAPFARWVEKMAGRTLHRSIVLTEKDRDLLIRSGVPAARIRVVPPLFGIPTGSSQRAHENSPSQEPSVLFVGYLFRHENRDAVRWLIDEIMPLVRQAVPGARLRVVGGGAPEEFTRDIAGVPWVEARGFVGDLWGEYAAADCSVIPLRDGAGVKFKTIESLLSGTPTVATSIGAEGVGCPDDFTAIADGAHGIADGIVRALTSPAELARAENASRRLRLIHGRDAFDSAVEAAYLVSGPR